MGGKILAFDYLAYYIIFFKYNESQKTPINTCPKEQVELNSFEHKYKKGF